MNFSKNKISRKILQLYVIAVYCILASCGKDFLNPPVQGSVQRQLYVKDLQTTEEFLGGIYNELTSILGGSQQLYPEVIADNLKPAGTLFSRHYNWQQAVDERNNATMNLNQMSTNMYKVIYGCNFVIDCGERFKAEDEIKANSLKGQALTIRALMYFLLVNYFAQPYGFTGDAAHPGVAINPGFDWTDLPSKRSTVAEVYAYMLSDLKTSVPLLPTSQGTTLFVNRNAAKSLLARVYLFKGDYQNAKSYAREIVAAVPIMVNNYPANLYTLKATEAIFQVDQNKLANVQLAGLFLRSPVQFYATADLAAMLTESPTDARRTWLIKSTSGATTWTVSKFPQDVIPGINNPFSAYYPTVFRSSEMCLVAAEAYAQLNNADSAKFYLDAIRKRADPVALATTANGTALLDAIYRERRKELAFEGLRMFDLLRLKKGVSRVDALTDAVKELPYPSNKAIAPIPGQDVKLQGLIQNVDY